MISMDLLDSLSSEPSLSLAIEDYTMSVNNESSRRDDFRTSVGLLGTISDSFSSPDFTASFSDPLTPLVPTRDSPSILVVSTTVDGCSTGVILVVGALSTVGVGGGGAFSFSLFLSSDFKNALTVSLNDLFGLQSSAEIGVCWQTEHVVGKVD
jgi:hypothetical protein